MDLEKKKRLEAQGYRVGNATEILGLTPAQTALVEFRVSVSIAVRRLRGDRGLSQAAAGKLAGASQAQVARIEGHGGESGKDAVSADLMLKLLFALGGTIDDLKRVPKCEPEVVTGEPRRAAAKRPLVAKVAQPFPATTHARQAGKLPTQVAKRGIKTRTTK